MDISKSFGFIAVASETTPVAVNMIAVENQAELINIGAFKLSEKDITQNIPILFLVLTGGTEQKILSLHNKRKEVYPNEPIVLLAHKSNNSLPAALEVLARIQQDGKEGKIIYLDEKPDRWKSEILKTIKYYKVYYRLLETKIGLVGEPSDWLVASSPETAVVRNAWGAGIEKININELLENVDGIRESEIYSNYNELTGNAEAVKEPSEKEILHSVKVYVVLKKMIAKYALTALTVRCFDLVTDQKTTGCYALSKLNDEGIMAGCEGDLVSTIGMIWIKYLTGKPVWMANPSRLDEESNSLWLAHCTVPAFMTEKYALRSHFESGLGVGIQGEFANGKVTLLRLGGKNLDKAWIAEGEITGCGNDENLCRTQIHIKLELPARTADLLNAPLGNHVLVVKGSYTGELREWKKLFIS
jgi:L-fucose isomerase-like protein